MSATEYGLRLAVAWLRSGDAADSIGELVALAQIDEDSNSRTSVFDGLTEAELKQVVAGGHHLVLNDGDTVVRTGNVARTLFAVMRGTIEIRKGDRVLDVVGSGDVFGEIAFFLDGPRTADAHSVGTSEIVSFDAGALDKLLKRDPPLASKLLLNLNRLLATKLARSTTT